MIVLNRIWRHSTGSYRPLPVIVAARRGRFAGTTVIAILLLGILLTGCGGSGGSDDDDSSHTLGGTVSGLTGTLVLTNTANNDSITLTANGSYTFSEPLDDGDSYNVTITTQPAAGCTVSNGAGTARADVGNVAVSCTVIDELTLRYRSKTFQLLWPAVSGATYYRLFENPDGVSGYTQIGGDITATSYDHVLTVPLWERLNASYLMQACDASGCGDDSDPVFVAGTLAEAVGYVKASNTDANDNFGVAIALSADGTTLAVGAYGEDSAATGVNGNQSDDTVTAAGAVYVYTRSGGAWAQQAYIKPSLAGANDSFGYALALSADGNTLAVGAYLEDSNSTVIGGNQVNNDAIDAGAVYVYTRSGSAWSSLPIYIKPPNTQAGDHFGSALALSANGNTLAVGAELEDGIGNAAADAGALYIFVRASGIWTVQTYISGTDVDDNWGSVLALSADGNSLAVGVRFEDSLATGVGSGTDPTNELATDAGAVYLFTRAASVWSLQAYFKASNTEELDRFGAALALSGDGATLAVGAYREDSAATGIGGVETDNTAPNAGAVYVFADTGGIWAQQAYIKASNAAASDEFGFALALSGDGNTLAVGARLEDSAAIGIDGDQADNKVRDSGAVYIFSRAGSNWSEQAYVKAPNTGGEDLFGSVIALSTDGGTLAAGVNEEDSDATGIGGDQTDNSAASAGAVYLY